MLTIRPWRFGWLGLIPTCGAAACCDWMAYTPTILIVSAENGPNSHAWMAQGVRRLLFDPVGARLIPLPVVDDPSLFSVEHTWGGQTVGGENNHES